MQKVLWIVGGAMAVSAVAYANELTRPSEQSEINVKPVVDNRQHQEESLKQATMEVEKPSVYQISEQELLANPQILERLYLEALVKTDKPRLKEYRRLYQSVENADVSLIEWSDAI
jgi:hypothetical protein